MYFLPQILKYIYIYNIYTIYTIHVVLHVYNNYMCIHSPFLNFCRHSSGVEETEMLKSVTDNQKILEYSCLGAVWSYSELEEDRRIILKKIGLDMFVKSLIRSPWQADELDREVININECAVGCLSQ